MNLITILNRCHRFKGFKYEKAWFGNQERLVIEVFVKPRKGSKPRCGLCGRRCSGYDSLPARHFEFIPIWGFAVFLCYRRRRVNCMRCGIVAELLPWAQGKHHLTTAYMQFLANWARKLSWLEVARSFRTSWEKVHHSVAWIVRWGLDHRVLGPINSIGVDEIQYSKGHKYLTLVYQIDAGLIRLLWVGKDRTIETFEEFFEMLGRELSAKIQYVCSDMWKPYLNVIRNKCSQAVHILDRFHIVAHMNKAVDEVRSAEARRMKSDGYEPVLKNSRWCLLKRKKNLREEQKGRLRELLSFNLRTVRAYLLKEDFQEFWEYISPTWAGKFLDRWCRDVMRSRIEPMKKMAGMLRSHRELILNWFKAKGQISNGVAEGLNNKAKVTMRKSNGFRSEEALETVRYHNLGALPDPEFAHKFW